MNSYVLDTMALVLFLEKRRVSSGVRKIFEQFEKGQAIFMIPSMVMVELAYLSEKSRIDTTIGEFESLLYNNLNSCELIPLDMPFIKAAFQITDIPELHDRLISGTALQLGMPLITNDPVISKSRHMVNVVW